MNRAALPTATGEAPSDVIFSLHRMAGKIKLLVVQDAGECPPESTLADVIAARNFREVVRRVIQLLPVPRILQAAAPLRSSVFSFQDYRAHAEDHSSQSAEEVSCRDGSRRVSGASSHASSEPRCSSQRRFWAVSHGASTVEQPRAYEPFKPNDSHLGLKWTFARNPPGAGQEASGRMLGLDPLATAFLA